VLFGLEDADKAWRDPFRPGQLPGLLPAGTYRFANAPHDVRLATLAFLLGRYRFQRYRKNDAPAARLVPPEGVDAAEVTRMAEAARLARDLINTRPTTWGRTSSPPRRRRWPRASARRLPASSATDLLAQNFPLIHAVGMASARAPRLIDIGWGEPSHPKVTLVGKGVCFDTGGLGPQAVKRHADHEEGHGRRRQRAGAGADGDGRRAQGAAARADPGGGERGGGNAFRPLDIFPRARGSTSRSATPTPRAGWCWPTRWRSPTRRAPTF